MSKQKTRKSITKRFKVTKTGKVLRMQNFKGHLNVKKSAKRRRRLQGTVVVKAAFANRIRKVLGR